MSLAPRAVVVHRRSEYDELLARHGTRRQAEWFLAARGRAVDAVVERHDALHHALREITAAIPVDWRRAELERGELARFVFGPEDVILVVGQDGLVANIAKYLDSQPVVGVNPEPERNPGVLVPYSPQAGAAVLAAAAGVSDTDVEARTMVEARLDDGQTLAALNELYVGHASHQSARYLLTPPDPAAQGEHQSSSGVLAGTGTGATGWLRSAWQERHSTLTLPAPTDAALCWFVREAWPSPATQTSLTEGLVMSGAALSVQAESDELVCFGDGIEADALHLTWGQRLEIRIAERRLRLVRL